MQTSNERKQHKQTIGNEKRNTREDNEKQNRTDSDFEKGDTQNAFDDQGTSAGRDTGNSLNKSSVSLRRRSKYFRNDTL